MRKKLLSFSLVLIMVILSFGNFVYAEDAISVVVNGIELQCDTVPFIENGRTMVPMRKIFEALGATVSWDNPTQTVTATKDGVVIVLQISSLIMYKNWVPEELDVAPMIVNGSTFVPVRAVSQSLNATVEWNNDTRTVIINTPAPQVKVMMYSANGAVIEVLESEVETYKSVGWYLEPVVLMYDVNGNTIYVGQSSVADFQSVGWYLEPVVLMYAYDGTTMYVGQSSVADYQSVGWSTTPPKKTTPTTSYDDNSTPRGSTVYRTPTGKRYHYSADCAGKNAIKTTVSEAMSRGLTPCKSCS